MPTTGNTRIIKGANMTIGDFKRFLSVYDDKDLLFIDAVREPFQFADGKWYQVVMCLYDKDHSRQVSPDPKKVFLPHNNGGGMVVIDASELEKYLDGNSGRRK